MEQVPPNPQLSFHSHLAPVQKAILVFGVIVTVILFFFCIYFAYLNKMSYNKATEEAKKAQEATDLAQEANVPSGWQTYTNTEYGFEFKYPESHTAYSRVDFENNKLFPARSNDNDVKIAESEAQLFCCDANTLGISVLNQNISPQAWLLSNSSKYFYEGTITSSNIINFQGYSATEVMGGGYLDSYYRLLVISKNGYLIVISQHLNSEFLNQVFSTFRFTDSGISSDWKTYTNEVYGFEIKYPITGNIYSGSVATGDEYRFYVGGGSQIFIGLDVESMTFCSKWGSNYTNSSYSPCASEISNSSFYEKMAVSSQGVIKYTIYCKTEGGMGDAPPLTTSDKEICKKVAESFDLIPRESMDTWKTYRSTVYGVEFKYPPGLCLKEGVQEPLSKSSGLGLFLDKCPGTYDPYTTRRYLQNIGPEFIGISFIKDSRPVKEQLDPSAPREQITVNGVSGYYAPNTLSMERAGPTISTNRWLFTSPTGYSVFIEDKPEITNLILSTFKFTK